MYYDIEARKTVKRGVFWTKVMYDTETMTPIYILPPDIENVPEKKTSKWQKTLSKFF